MAVESIHQPENVCVTRVLSDDGTWLVRKRVAGGLALSLIRHEAAILARVQGVVGVPHLSLDETLDGVLSYCIAGEQNLADLLAARRLSVGEALGIAIRLCRILNDVHQAGVVHRDVQPVNVLLDKSLAKVGLDHFNLASHLLEGQPAFCHQNHILGAPAYSAPELSGRTGRQVDHRADLYSLGATLYELLTGRPPFVHHDLLEMLHAHMVCVPSSPSAVNPSVPGVLSAIVLRLLEKEPDRRYQSAAGLMYDLQRCLEMGAQEAFVHFTLGERDFAWQLLPPSRLIGRDQEVELLAQAINRAQIGGCPAVIIRGAAGVGKTALVGELRPLIASRKGWFVSGKFDQYRLDAPSATQQSLRALGRLLLAEPEDVLVPLRARLIEALGANIDIGPALLPEFMTLLGPRTHCVPCDPREAEARMLQSTLDLLRAIASPQRPIVMLLDDLQWAPSVSLKFLDAFMNSSRPIEGLLLVAAYREDEVDVDHPLHAMLARWREAGMSPMALALGNLTHGHVVELLGDMLRATSQELDELAFLLDERTGGNPFETVELVNALRQTGLLRPAGGRWQWDVPAIRGYVGQADVDALLASRMAGTPAATQDVLRTMACLGGAVKLSALEMVFGAYEAVLDALVPAIDDGLLMTEQRDEIVVRFRHDRVQQMVFEQQPLAARLARHLKLARRLNGCTEHWGMAAEQYLAAQTLLSGEDELRSVGHLFQRVARSAQVSNYAVTARYTQAAIEVLELAPNREGDDARRLRLDIELHAALYGLGHLEESDRVFARITSRCNDLAVLLDAAGVQLYSLTNRSRYQEALSMGLDLLAKLGLSKPENMQQALGEGVFKLVAWHSGVERERDLIRPQASAPSVLALGRLLIQTGTPAFFCDPHTFAWLILEAHRLWVEHGPCAQFMPNMSAAAFLLVSAPQDYAGAYTTARHVLTVGEVRGFEPGTSLARYIFCACAAHWRESIEDVVGHFLRAREGLIQAGDPHYAGYTHLVSDLLLDLSPTLDRSEQEVEAGLAFASRACNSDYTMRLLPRRQLFRALRGQTEALGCLSDEGFDEAAHALAVGEGTSSAAMYRIFRMISAAIFDDQAALAAHSAVAMPVLPRATGYYVTAMAHALRGLSLAQQARSAAHDERARLLQELDTTVLPWLRRRAADAPCNYHHLALWIEAERRWVDGDVWQTGALYEQALNVLKGKSRPWHRALITERMALFEFDIDMERDARRLMASACEQYESWGAAGKANALRQRYPFLNAGVMRSHTAQLSTNNMVPIEVVDLLAVLRASQALSSETSLSQLTQRLVHVMGTLTGATHVHLLVRQDPSPDWCLASSMVDGQPTMRVQDAAAQGMLSLPAFRYVERTAEVLLVDDLTRDDRFNKDDHGLRFEHCSLMALPVMRQGDMCAVLMLENRLRRAAFTVERLDSVSLIAGQLSVSLDNALLYASLERKVSERTVALEAANQRLAHLSVTDALTGIANRRRFDEAIEAEWERAKRAGQPLALALIDVDFFKLYNDHYGHQAGDACLHRVAQTLAAQGRAGIDLVARYGGEEFVMLLPGTDGAGAALAGERLRQAVASLALPHVKAAMGQVTVSIGVASVTPAGLARIEDLVAQADDGLYVAKRDGRNCVRLADLVNSMAAVASQMC